MATASLHPSRACARRAKRPTRDDRGWGVVVQRRRVWAPRGTRPTAPGDRRYEWMSVDALVRPTTGDSWWWLLPTVSAAGIDLVALPPSSPELQPAERLWPPVNEAVTNRHVADLEAVLVDRCCTLRADRVTIRALTRYHWWPADEAPTIRT